MIRRRTTPSVLASLLVLCTEVNADSTRYDALTERLISIKREIDMPAGFAAAIVKGSDLVYEGYAGFSNVETAVPVDAKTHFYIASTTKAFLSLAVLLAESRGEVKESTTLKQLFPRTAFPNIDPSRVTVKHLLTHTSGLDNEAFTWAASYSGQHDAALRRKFVSSLHHDSQSKLGEHHYTNLGYNVMSVWFDDFYGKDWRVTLDETILAPLKMASTSGFMSDIDKRGWTFAQPYSYKYEDGKKQVYLRKDDSTMYSIGLISTTRDVSRFLIAEINEGVIDGQRVFPADVISKSHQRQVDANSYYDGYAWGWQLGTFEGEREVFHTGGFVGASALISFLPEQDVGIVVLQNESGLRANYLAQIFKQMAYSAALGSAGESADARIDGMIEDLRTRADAARAEQEATTKKLTAMPSTLSVENERYAGSYLHELAGEIIVSSNDEGRLTARWGNLRGLAFAHTAPDHVSISFWPGELHTAQFHLDAGEVAGLTINGQEFRRRSAN